MNYRFLSTGWAKETASGSGEIYFFCNMSFCIDCTVQNYFWEKNTFLSKT